MKESEKRPVIHLNAGGRLKKVIIENPDLPVLMFAGQYAWTGDYDVNTVEDIRIDVTEVLDCAQEIEDEILFTEKSEFEEAIENYVLENDLASDPDECYEVVARIASEYEPYWKKCIVVTIG